VTARTSFAHGVPIASRDHITKGSANCDQPQRAAGESDDSPTQYWWIITPVSLLNNTCILVLTNLLVIVFSQIDWQNINSFFNLINYIKQSISANSITPGFRFVVCQFLICYRNAALLLTGDKYSVKAFFQWNFGHERIIFQSSLETHRFQKSDNYSINRPFFWFHIGQTALQTFIQILIISYFFHLEFIDENIVFNESFDGCFDKIGNRSVISIGEFSKTL